jgi:non-ribosomal peptide synthetase component F
MHAWKGVDDLVLGSPMANRNKQVDRETMGYYAGVVPLRGKIRPERSFREMLQETHSSAMDSFANAMPFVEIAKAVGDAPAPGHHPVFDVRFALQNHPIPDVDIPGLSAKLRMRSTGTARFHLGCEVTEQDAGMEVAWLHRQGVLDEAGVRELDRRFQAMLAAVCTSPDTRISDLSAV